MDLFSFQMWNAVIGYASLCGFTTLCGMCDKVVSECIIRILRLRMQTC